MAYFHTTVLDNQIKALPTVDTASGSVATFETDLTERLADWTLDNSATTITRCATANFLPLILNEIKSLNTSGVWNDNEYTLNNVTFTLNLDGDNNIISIKVNGTATATTTLRLAMSTIKNGLTYNFVGCPSGGSATTYELMMVTGGFNSGLFVRDIGNGVTFASTANASRGVQIVVRSGYNANNLIYKPMLTLDTSATYDDFVYFKGDIYTISDIRSLVTYNGINNIFADIGDIDISYLLSVGKIRIMTNRR